MSSKYLPGGLPMRAEPQTKMQNIRRKVRRAPAILMLIAFLACPGEAQADPMDVAYMQVMQAFNAAHTFLAELQAEINSDAQMLSGFVQTMAQGIVGTMITDQLARLPLMQMTYDLAHQHMVPHQLCRIAAAHQIGQNLADATMAASTRLMSTMFNLSGAGSVGQRLAARCPYVSSNTAAGQYGAKNNCSSAPSVPAGLYLVDADLDVDNSVFNQRQFALPATVEKPDAGGRLVATPNPVTAAEWKWMAAHDACEMAMPDLPNPPGQSTAASNSTNNDVSDRWAKARARVNVAFSKCVQAVMRRTAITNAVAGGQNLQDWKNQSDNACQILSWMGQWGDPDNPPGTTATPTDGTTPPTSLSDCQTNGISLDMYEYLLAGLANNPQFQTKSLTPPQQNSLADNGGVVGENPLDLLKKAQKDGPEAMAKYEEKRDREKALFTQALAVAEAAADKVPELAVR